MSSTAALMDAAVLARERWRVLGRCRADEPARRARNPLPACRLCDRDSCSVEQHRRLRRRPRAAFPCRRARSNPALVRSMRGVRPSSAARYAAPAPARAASRSPARAVVEALKLAGPRVHQEAHPVCPPASRARVPGIDADVVSLTEMPRKLGLRLPSLACLAFVVLTHVSPPVGL